MRFGCLYMLALLSIVACILAVAHECAPTNKICKVAYNDNTVATYECRYVDVHKNYIVIRTKDGKVNIPMSCVKMFTTEEMAGR